MTRVLGVSLRRVVSISARDPDVLKYLRGFGDLPVASFRGMSFSAPGKLWRGFRMDWLDDVQRAFGTVELREGGSYTYDRSPYSAWTDGRGEAYNFMIRNSDFDKHEFQFLLSCDPPAARVVVDFRALPEYGDLKYKQEREVVLSGPVRVRLEGYKHPFSEWKPNFLESLPDVDKVWSRDRDLLDVYQDFAAGRR